MDRGKTVTQCKPRGKPFRPRSIGLYLLGRHPIRSKGGGSHGPGLNVSSTSLCPQPPGLASLARRKGKAGAIRKPAQRNAPVSKSRDVRINASDRMLDHSGYAYLPARAGERDRRRFRVIGGEGHEVWRRLEERPGFPGAKQRIIRARTNTVHLVILI